MTSKSPNYQPGVRYGRLVIVSIKPIEGDPRRGVRMAVVDCDCGNKGVVVRASKLVQGNTRSCGCLRRELARARRIAEAGPVVRKVAKKATRTYQSWMSMTSRCTNPRSPNWPRYGGRGITICDRWRGAQGFENFLADMGERPPGKSLDRRDNSKGYSPDNCRWATPKEQAENRRPPIRRNAA